MGDGVVYPPGATQAALDAVQALIPPTSFIAAAPMTVATLLATYPAAVGYLGKYARVTDLWGQTDEVMRCSTDGTTYFWRPQRTDYAINLASTGGAVPLTPLVTAPVVFLTATTLTNMTITPSVTNAYPGQQFTVTMTGIIGALLTVNLTGLLGSNLSFLTGATKTVTYTAAGWRAT